MNSSNIIALWSGVRFKVQAGFLPVPCATLALENISEPYWRGSRSLAGTFRIFLFGNLKWNGPCPKTKYKVAITNPITKNGIFITICWIAFNWLHKFVCLFVVTLLKRNHGRTDHWRMFTSFIQLSSFKLNSCIKPQTKLCGFLLFNAKQLETNYSIKFFILA